VHTEDSHVIDDWGGDGCDEEESSRDEKEKGADMVEDSCDHFDGMEVIT